MCGIAGIINISGRVPEIPRHLKAMTDTVRHRGPDGEGFLFIGDDFQTVPAFGSDTPADSIGSKFSYSPAVSVEQVPDGMCLAAIGHRRLSIIDVSPAGHQPMCDAEKKIWIVYNGEIYNHIELREELSRKGFVFRTHTDTEVILHAYLQWGEECVSHFNGMWSFVIYDSTKRSLFGSRDRTGVKPFYYYKDASVFAFASEQKALVKLPFVKTGIHPQVAADFLAGDIYFMEKGNENLFKNIFELMPSENFSFDLKLRSLRKWKYYSLKTSAGSSGFNESKFQDCRDTTEKLFLNAVRLRLRSDVPVGSCLSGGIDSSAIVCVMDSLIRKGLEVNVGSRLNVFTLKFEDREIDETRWAKYVVDQTNSEWNLAEPTAEDLMKDFRDMNYAQDIPVCSTGTYGQFRLMRMAKEKGIKVILDGQGGDELFGGYASHSQVFHKELLRKWKLVQSVSEMSAGGKLLFNGRQILRQAFKSGFSAYAPYELQRSVLRSRYPQYRFLNDSVIDTCLSGQGKDKAADTLGASSLNEALWRDFTGPRLKMYLKYEDRSSMWHSIEARVPFADDLPLIEHVFRSSGSFKIHKGVNKFLLREAAGNYLPQEIRERKDKLGFVTPIDQWMKQIRTECLDILDDSVSDFMDVRGIRENPDAFFSINEHADGVRVFRMISFALWKKIFNL